MNKYHLPWLLQATATYSSVWTSSVSSLFFVVRCALLLQHMIHFYYYTSDLYETRDLCIELIFCVTDWVSPDTSVFCCKDLFFVRYMQYLKICLVHVALDDYGYNLRILCRIHECYTMSKYNISKNPSE